MGNVGRALDVASNLHALKRLIELAWVELQAKVKAMGASCAVRPNQAGDVFQYADGDPIVVTIQPVTFLLKEKPYSVQPELYVVVEGSISFKLDNERKFRAVRSHTRVGYFLRSHGTLSHVYGVHYDFDDKLIAHPVFHSQMAPMMDLSENINTAWKEKFTVTSNHVQHLLANVRIPTAQMDAFSVFLQLCSDHLVNSKSVKVQTSAYQAAIKACSFYQSAYADIPRLHAAVDQKCFRPQHWYDGSILPAAIKGAAEG